MRRVQKTDRFVGFKLPKSFRKEPSLSDCPLEVSVFCVLYLGSYSANGQESVCWKMCSTISHKSQRLTVGECPCR